MTTPHILIFAILVATMALFLWGLNNSPQLLERFNRRKRTVTGKWHMDETYIKVRGNGDTSTVPSTASATRSSSSSANTVT